MAKKKTRTRQARTATLTAAQKAAKLETSEVWPNGGVRLQRGKAYAAANEKFGDLADKLAEALAAVLDHEDCPEYLAMRIVELHNGLVTEFNVEVSHDIRMRFADAAVYAAEGRRPA